MRPRVTMSDVAREAGISQAAVSKIFSHKDAWISEATRQRVIEVAERLGYRQNYHARLLRTGKTYCLGLMGNIQGFSLDNYVYTKTSRGIADELNDTSSPYSLLMFGANWGSDYEKSLKLVEHGMVDGLIWILLSNRIDDFTRTVDPWLRARNVPFVVVHSLSRRTFTYPNVGLDSYAGAYAATAHLASLRRKRIGIYLTGASTPQGQEMYEGYRQALADNKLPFDSKLHLHDAPQAQVSGGNLFKNAYRAATALPRKSLPDAIMISIDACAYGFLRAFQERGIKVPEEIALTGFDDEVTTSYVEPVLTTVHHPFAEKGREAVRMLTGLLDGTLSDEPPPQRILKPHLVIRKT